MNSLVFIREKISIVVLSLLLIGNVKAQPIQIEVKDRTLLEVVDNFWMASINFLDSVGFKNDSKGVIVIDYFNYDLVNESIYSDESNLIFNDTLFHKRPKGDFRISLVQNPIHFFKNDPSFYFMLKGVLVVVYSGFEDFMKTNGMRRTFKKKIQQGVPDEIYSTALPSWMVRIDNLKDPKFVILYKSGFQ